MFIRQSKLLVLIIMGIIVFSFIGCLESSSINPANSPGTASQMAGPQAAVAASSAVSGIYGGGPIYKNRSVTISELKASGFTEVIVWNIAVSAAGDLNFNGEFPVASNGSYTGGSTYPNFASDMSSLKSGTTSVTRVTFCIGSSNVGDFQHIRDLINSQGTGSTSILYKNFLALKNATGVNAIDLDDENCYDQSTMVQFCVMLGNMGLKVSLCPYTNSSFWTSVASQVNSQRAGTIDAVNLQCYAGGGGNSPCSGWNFGGIPVHPGLWDTNDTPSQVQTHMSSWKSSCGITGGWMWLYDDFVNNGKAAQYANAINTALGGGSAPGAATNPNPANNATGVSTTTTLSWTAGSGATSHDVYFGTSNPPASKGNQTGTTYNPGTLTANTKYYWRIDEKNSVGTTTGTVWNFTTGSTGGGTDITNLGGTITAQYTDSPSGEDIAKLIDNNTATKYLTFHSSGWVQFQASSGAVVVKYTITSANDVPARDPKNWTLQGSNNGSSWTTLNTQSNQTFASRFLTKTYTFSNSTSYTYYRLNVTAVGSGSIMQMAEWELWKN